VEAHLGDRSAHVQRLHAWRHGAHAAVCDRIAPWAHGTIGRASRYPSYYSFNLVRVEDDPRLSVEELLAVAEEALADLPHRRIDFDLAAAAEPPRPAFKALGWESLRLLWMRHRGADRLPGAGGGGVEEVEEVPYEAVDELRVRWHDEDFPGGEDIGYYAAAREVAMRRGARVLAVRERGAPISFAQLECDGDDAEITQVYVHPDHRGRGVGTATTRAAIDAASSGDLWICADDEDRAKHLYARLGFEPIARTAELQRRPLSP
jgi:ribosomal protein S18 acetylase RimI-like enzyme